MRITGKFTNEHLICTDEERLYLYSQSIQISAQTGFQGYLRGNFDSSGKVFHHNFFPFHTPVDLEFADALQKVMETLREGILKSFDDMRSFCYQDGYDGKIPSDIGEQAFAFRIDNGNFSFFFRLTLMQETYHVYCFCYRLDWLSQHMKKAESGIRFITPNYQELFRLKDGGRIHVSNLVGQEAKEYTCRFIDDYHVKVGCNLYHICEFAEWLQANGNTVAAVEGKIEN